MGDARRTTRRIIGAALALTAVIFAAVTLPTQLGRERHDDTTLLPSKSTPAWGAAKLVQLLNAERVRRWLPPLKVLPRLVAAATSHSARMASQRRLYQDPRLAATIRPASAWGENVACVAGIEELHRALMSSSRHRINILEPTFNAVGVGIAMGTSCTWTTQVFAAVPVSEVELPRTEAGSKHSASPASRRYGVDQDYHPSYDVLVRVGELGQPLVNSAPPGTRFGIAPGKHRLAGVLRPKRGQQFLGLPGAAISGSKLLTGWVRGGPNWYVTGQTQRFPVVPRIHPKLGIPYCDETAPMCRFSEDTFYDGRSLTQVGHLSELGPGKVYFDYRRSRIYIADDPNDHIVETTRTEGAFQGGGPDVRIQNLVIEQFATPTQAPAMVDGRAGGWQIINNELRLSHGAALTTGGDNWTVAGNKIHHNGQLGVGGQGRGGQVRANEMAFNNAQGYRRGFESGASKWSFSTGLTVRDNWVHHNFGNGLWTDIDNLHTLYEGNLVEDNAWIGIFHEISYDAVIRHNIVRRNGVRSPDWLGGAGINATDSRNTEIYGNVVLDNLSGIVGRQDGRTGSGQHGRWELRDLSVHDNSIRHPAGTSVVGTSGVAAGLAASGGPESSTYRSRSNRFGANHYVLPRTVDGRFFAWGGRQRTWSEWQQLDLDLDGSVASR
ncbi:MAG TPA: right-handed parallel beta-helix repeat-containing protein [Propionibacteriaceae bacterium]|nr:right-handed parallel beta-helix repeat-containing protein [Propionibacteriaceae bacterium]